MASWQQSMPVLFSGPGNLLGLWRDVEARRRRRDKDALEAKAIVRNTITQNTSSVDRNTRRLIVKGASLFVQNFQWRARDARRAGSVAFFFNARAVSGRRRKKFH